DPAQRRRVGALRAWSHGRHAPIRDGVGCPGRLRVRQGRPRRTVRRRRRSAPSTTKDRMMNRPTVPDRTRPRRAPRIRRTLAALLAVTTLAACGGDDDDVAESDDTRSSSPEAADCAATDLAFTNLETGTSGTATYALA